MPGFYFGSFLVFLLIIGVGILTSKKNNNNYDNYIDASSIIVSGALIGTLVGGSSTIGTAQLAYSYGFSAWWFTLGGAIGIIILGCFLYKPLKLFKANTLSEIIDKEYGNNSGIISALLSAIGIFLSFVAQLLSGVALIISVTKIDYVFAILIVSLLIIIYVFWGGALSLGYSGIIKTTLLIITTIYCGGLSIIRSGGINELVFNSNLERTQYFNLFARGLAIDGGAGLSLVIGVITTQSYYTAIMMAKNYKEAKKSSIITAIIASTIGIASILVGMYMRLNFPNIDTKLALPMFILQNTSPFVSGIMISALLIAVIGTGAGLAFGMSSTIYRNVYKRIFTNTKELSSKKIIQIILLAIVVIGCVLCYFSFGDLILNWSFLSMGLRGVAIFVPLIFVLFFPNKVNGKYIVASMFCGVISTFLGKLFIPESTDPMLVGLLTSLLVIMLGVYNRKSIKKQ